MASGYGKTNTVVCPYNKSHNILKERFQTHLVKCAKNYPEIKLIKCPFNTTHLVKDIELDSHVLECDDRGSFDLYKFKIAPKVESEATRSTIPEPKYVPLPDSGENWDDDYCETYNPQAYVENAPVIRQLNVAPPSERRAFREAERLRLNRLNP